MKAQLLVLALVTSTLAQLSADPVHVKIEKTENGYQLLRDGKPYYIKGAGVSDHVKALAGAGANSLRTWGTEQTAELIDEAHELGLTVMAGLWIEHERHGIDYDDPEQVREQIERHKAGVDMFKDHPAVLMWAVGNEVWIDAENPKVWDTIEAIAAYIKEVDPHRPVMTVLAHVSEEEVNLIAERCPSIDLLGFNSYAGLDVLARDARRYGWNGPYAVTEWGPNGAWESDDTSWGAEIEPTTTQKAQQRIERYKLIQSDPHCIGSYAFFWGQKQEVTPTWFNLFLEDGTSVGGVDSLQYMWTGKYPENRAPEISPLRINKKKAGHEIIVSGGDRIQASFSLLSPDIEAVEVRWECLPESTDKRQGGDREERPQSINLNVEPKHPTEIVFQAPEQPGPYRLFAYVKTAAGKSAAANIPFLVR